MATERDAQKLRAAARGVRRQADAEERTLRKEILPGWRRVRAQLGKEADALAAKFSKAEAAGLETPVTWLHKQERYQTLLDQVETRIAELTKSAELPVTAMQRELIESAAGHAQKMVEAALAPAGRDALKTTMADWNRLPIADVEQMIGRTSKGTPLAGLLKEIAPTARTQAAQILTQGIAVGRNPRTVARELLNVSDAAQSRLETIARTEALGAQREATRLALIDNKGIVPMWRWEAALDERTCEACIALDGTTYPVEEEADAHVNCRCTMVPETASWEDLGLGDLGLPETGIAGELETGPDWFAKQPADLQRALLGPGKLDALNKGEIDWPDMVEHTHNKEWGGMRRAASLREAKANAARR